MCRGCVVRTECLEYALVNGEKFGIWGGLSERERRRIRRERTIARRAGQPPPDPPAGGAGRIHDRARRQPDAGLDRPRRVEVELRPPPGAIASSTAAGTSPTSSARSTATRAAHRVERGRRPHLAAGRPGSSTPGPGRRRRGRGPAPRPAPAPRPPPAGPRPAPRRRPATRCRPPARAGPRRTPPPRWGGAPAGRPSGASVGEGRPAHVGQRPLRPVGEAGQAQLAPGPRQEPVPGGDGVVHRRALQRDEGHHVDHPQAGMRPRVASAGRGGPPPPPPPPGPRPPPPSPARVSTDRWWWGSECTSSRHRPPAAARSATTPRSRPSLTLTTHSSTVPTLAQPDCPGGDRPGPPAVRLPRARGGAGAAAVGDGGGHCPAGGGPRVPLPLAVRPPLPRPPPLRRRAARPRAPGSIPCPSWPPWPGSRAGCGWGRSPSARPSARPPSPPSSWPPSTSSPADGSSSAWARAGTRTSSAVAGIPFRRPGERLRHLEEAIQVTPGDVRRGPVHVRRPLRAGGRRHVPAPTGPAAGPAHLGRGQGRPPPRPRRPPGRRVEHGLDLDAGRLPGAPRSASRRL